MTLFCFLILWLNFKLHSIGNHSKAFSTGLLHVLSSQILVVLILFIYGPSGSAARLSKAVNATYKKIYQVFAGLRLCHCFLKMASWIEDRCCKKYFRSCHFLKRSSRARFCGSVYRDLQKCFALPSTNLTNKTVVLY